MTMDGGNAAAATSTSSDFVRKLYKMLEDPSYRNVVRWNDIGDSFVVLETEKFTKNILPKHFKHSNFASFVRQLNKYDFHKVRNNEESGGSQYGEGAWEFKHPEFQIHNKDQLDNIRRKAPAPRKAAQSSEADGPNAQQMDLLNGQLGAMQTQQQQLVDKYSALSHHHQLLLQEVIGLQRTVVNHENVIQNLMSYLHSVDGQMKFYRRNSTQEDGASLGAESSATATHRDFNIQQQITPSGDHPASPLQAAQRLMSDFSSDQLKNGSLEYLSEMYNKQINGSLGTPPPEPGLPESDAAAAQRGGSGSNSSNTPAAYSRYMGSDLNDTVYPVGHIPPNSIDPMYQQQIPYPVPQNPGLEPADPRRTFTARKKSATLDPGWTRTPNILLVEDDPTCRRIGGKFLLSFKCAIDSAFDGLEAVNKLNHGAKYDLVLMDIIMPNLDGVSATHLIRGFDTTPIIAMTSNIRSDDISMYFSHGMNDVLPKPFTKEGLLTMLEKHLGHLKVPKQAAQLPRALNASSTAASHSDGQSPGKSPTDRWGQSPRNSGPQDVSPSSATVTDEYMSSMRGPQYAVENSIHRGTGTAFSSPTSVGTPGQRGHRRVASDMEDSHIESEAKRQRMYIHQTTPSIPGMHIPSVPPG